MTDQDLFYLKLFLTIHLRVYGQDWFLLGSVCELKKGGEDFGNRKEEMEGMEGFGKGRLWGVYFSS